MAAACVWGTKATAPSSTASAVRLAEAAAQAGRSVGHKGALVIRIANSTRMLEQNPDVGKKSVQDRTTVVMQF